MASVLTLSVVAAVIGWGLRRRCRWARWFLIILGAIPPVALVAGLGLQARGTSPAIRELGDVMTMPCVGVFVFPAGVVACWVACSHRGRAVFSTDYEGLVEKTPKISATWNVGLRFGLGLAFAMLILYWTLNLLILSVLVGCGVIRSN